MFDGHVNKYIMECTCPLQLGGLKVLEKHLLGGGSEISILVGGVVLLGESNFVGGNGGVREFRRKIENCINPV